MNVTLSLPTHVSLQKMRGRKYFRDLKLRFGNDFNWVK